MFHRIHGLQNSVNLSLKPSGDNKRTIVEWLCPGSLIHLERLSFWAWIVLDIASATDGAGASKEAATPCSNLFQCYHSVTAW